MNIPQDPFQAIFDKISAFKAEYAQKRGVPVEEIFGEEK